MRLAAIFVHYHTPELLAPAWEALAREAAANGWELEGVVVDNGSRPQDRHLLEALPARLLEPQRNLGYAGGANLGLRETTGELALVLNPDVVVLPGCLGALCAELGSGAAVAGPRFYWDHERRFLLPPTERRGRSAELAALLARRAGWGGRRVRRAWRRHAYRAWRAGQSYLCYELSGALLALRREAWERVPFDDAYPLYFEETDWLLRLRSRGLEARFVPAAEAVHLYARSSVREPAASAFFETSARRFRRRFYGAAWSRLLERLDRSLPEVGEERSEIRCLPGFRQLAGTAPAGRAAWLEVSRSPAGFPAAGHPLEAGGEDTWDVPAEILERLGRGRYYLRLADATGKDLAVESRENAL